MKRLVTGIAMAAALSMPIAPLQAQDAKVYKTSGPWAMDYGEDYCRLAGTFSDGEDEVALAMERIQPGPTLRLVLIGNGIKLFRRATEVGYRFLPSGADRSAVTLRSDTADGQQYLNLGPTTLADIPAPAPGSPPAPPPPYTRDGEKAVAKGITGLLLDGGVTKPVRIDTGSLDAAIGALQTCTDELVAYWGLDAEAHKTLSRPVFPAEKTSGWVAADTIPFSDFAKLSGGQNEVRLMVDKTGKPTSCHIHWPALSQSVNDKICKSLMEKASFTPALDQSGEAIDSYWTTSVFFLLPPPG